MKLNLAKKRLQTISVVLPLVGVAIGNFAPANIENVQTALYISYFRHALPEIIFLFLLSVVLLFLPRPIPHYFQAAYRVWRVTFSGHAFSGKWKYIAAAVPAIVVGMSALGCGYYLEAYARARYSYWFREGVHRDFQVEQLAQAFQYEAGYQYEKAIQKYVDLAEIFPHAKNAALLKERISLNRGLLDYAEQMYELGKQEERKNGVSRLALDLYLEAIRVNPRHMESRRKLEKIRQFVDDHLADALPLVEQCYMHSETTGVEAGVSVEMLTFLIDLPPVGKSISPFRLCTVASRFPNERTFMETVRRSWQQSRLTAAVAFSDGILAGKSWYSLLGHDELKKNQILMLPPP